MKPHDDLEIPDFLKRNPDGSFKHPERWGLDTATVSPEPAPVEPEPGDEFARFNVGLYDPEPDILREARERRRNWVPVKGQAHQPALRTFIRIVREEWKKQGKL